MAESVDLGPRLENLVSHLIQTGRFRTRTEVIQAGLRIIEEQENALEAFDSLIEEGLADAVAGRVVTSGDLHARLTMKYNQMPHVPHDV